MITLLFDSGPGFPSTSGVGLLKEIFAELEMPTDSLLVVQPSTWGDRRTYWREITEALKKAPSPKVALLGQRPFQAVWPKGEFHRYVGQIFNKGPYETLVTYNPEGVVREPELRPYLAAHLAVLLT